MRWPINFDNQHASWHVQVYLHTVRDDRFFFDCLVPVIPAQETQHT
jgi:hypothetical protein|eukprot:SAG25_NODE_612_length_6550_cov_63.066026_5_plen_46_part_00